LKILVIGNLQFESISPLVSRSVVCHVDLDPSSRIIIPARGHAKYRTEA